MISLRWADGFCCPHCLGRKAWPLRGRGVTKCALCGYQVSVTAGTSALSLKQNLGHGSYETAWVWLHKLRAAMVRPDRDRLAGRVEVDEAWIGGLDPDHIGGRHANSKSIVAVAAEERGRGGRGLARVRMRRIYAADGSNPQNFIRDVVTPGSVVHTDGWMGLRGPGQARIPA